MGENSLELITTSGGRELALYNPLPEDGVPAACVVAWHGKGGSPDEFMGMTKLYRIADLLGLAVVCPIMREEGSGWEWNKDSEKEYFDECVEYAHDLANMGRVFGVGFSMGGAMAQLMAARRPYRFDCVTVCSSGNPWTGYEVDPLQSPVPIDLIMHNADPRVPFTFENGLRWQRYNDDGTPEQVQTTITEPYNKRTSPRGLVAHYQITSYPEGIGWHTWYTQEHFGLSVSRIMLERWINILLGGEL